MSFLLKVGALDFDGYILGVIKAFQICMSLDVLLLLQQPLTQIAR